MDFRNCTVGIVDYQAGNIHSIQSALEYLGAGPILVREPGALMEVTHILLPGVGAFGHCAARLQASGLAPTLERAVFERGTPLLGICVGMQLLADHSEEMGGSDGLGWIGGAVRQIPAAPAVRVPHVGWNDVLFEENFGEFAQGERADFYFDHSFAYHDPRKGHTIGSCQHGAPFAAIVRQDNLVAAQFHPEKSQTAGLKFLRSFLALQRPC